jgi:hypothetical protein
MRMLLVAALACGTVALAGPALAGAQTLTATVLNGTANPTLGLGAVNVDCQPAGTSTVTYTVEGDSLGPYPGTFVESGTYTITGGAVDSFEATFTITSGTSEITGTKTLRTSSSAVCTPSPEPGITQFTDILIDASYEATITTPSGSSTDHGRATTAAQMLETATAASAAMQESFVSEGLAPTPGRVVGAGILEDAAHGWLVNAFTAKSDGATAQAKCTVLTDGFFVKCLDATLLNQTGTHVTFVGQAVVNGVPTGYRIDVDDLGHPGHGQDVFALQTDSGFHAEGTLAVGNIMIFD